MEGPAIKERVVATLDANADVRRQAEIDLKFAEENPAFFDALLSILGTDDNVSIRLAAAVYLKNRVYKAWSPLEEGSGTRAIGENQKNILRNRLIAVLASPMITSTIRGQIIPTITKILSYDFPTKWPEFLEHSIGLLNSNQACAVQAGALCLLAVCKVYRFRVADNRQDFEQVVRLAFPHLLRIANRTLEQLSEEAALILLTIIKAYKHAIYFQLPVYLREDESIVGWCTLFLNVISRDAPLFAMSEDLEERGSNAFWKAKKWSYCNLNRLFSRYGNSSVHRRNSGTKHLASFANTFTRNFAPEILKVYLQQVEKWVAKQAWLSKPCLYLTISFMDECIKPKAMWEHLRPHMETLLTHFLFPVVCQSDEDIELFETDPQEYLHRKLNFYDDSSAPDMAAANFLTSLTWSRRKQTFTVLNFINTVVNRYESTSEAEKNGREKEGALRMIGALAQVILGKNSPIADQVEYFFVRHVIPEFASKHGYLRARACDTLEQFERLDFRDTNNLLTVYKCILGCMRDEELPVRVKAALALQPLIRHEVIRRSMQENIAEIMQELLKLANEVDLDALANVMEDFVDVFATELTPFAVALCEQLRDTYLRIVGGMIERSGGTDGGGNGGVDDEFGEYFDDKSITALSVLQAIGTLILSLESSPEVLVGMERALLPVFEVTLENKLYDLYNEVFEIIDSCTFSAKRISPTMWRAFELLHGAFNGGGELYLEDMLPALENYVNYGREELVQNRGYLEALVSMIRIIFKDDKISGVDRVCGCKLMEVIIYSLRGHVDEYVGEFIELGLDKLGEGGGVVEAGERVKVKSWRIHLMEVVINGIYYNPLLGLSVLERKGWTNKFFSEWFSSMRGFTRVHDKKLCIAAISGLLTLSPESVPVSIQQGWPRLLEGIVWLFETLPEAERKREEAKKEEALEFQGEFGGDDDDSREEWAVDKGDWENDWSEGEDGLKTESDEYLEELTAAAEEEGTKFADRVEKSGIDGGSGLDDEDDDDLEEEGMIESGMEKVDVYQVFVNSLLVMQSQHTELYENLTKSLSGAHLQAIQMIIDKANNLVTTVTGGNSNEGKSG